MERRRSTSGDALEKLERAKRVKYFERIREERARRIDLWGEHGSTAITKLAKMFPGLRAAPGVEPWDEMKLLEWVCVHGRWCMDRSGERRGEWFWSALFVLSVWRGFDWGEMAEQEFEPRTCQDCGGLGRVGVGMANGERVRRGTVAGEFVLSRYRIVNIHNRPTDSEYLSVRACNPNDELIGDETVPTKRCECCEGTGEHRLWLSVKGRGRFDLLWAWSVWGQEEKRALETWLATPFSP